MTIVQKTIYPAHKLGTETRDINQLVPTGRIILMEGLKECLKQGLHLGVSCTLRDYVCQHKEFLEGSSQVDSWGSMHQFRISWDMFSVPKYHKSLYNTDVLRKASKIFRAKGCICGNDWNNNGKEDDPFMDRPHVQLVSIAEQKLIIAAYKKGGYDAVEAYVKRRFKR